MAKHAANTFLATSISFINEIADLCDEVGADALEVAQIMKCDRRIGRYAFLSPGLGFAGGTLGREIRALQKLGNRYGCPTPMMDSVMDVNLSRPKLVGQKLKGIYDDLAGLQIGVLGLTYKPGTSTMRRAVSLEICADLAAEGAKLLAYDPLANLEELDTPPPFQMQPDPYAVVEKSDAIVLITPWKELPALDLGKVRNLMRRPIFIDTCNYYEPGEMTRLGFVYCAIGRGYGPQGGKCEQA
jgi:UDPglucose 6-dehydrogenase